MRKSLFRKNRIRITIALFLIFISFIILKVNNDTTRFSFPFILRKDLSSTNTLPPEAIDFYPFLEESSNPENAKSLNWWLNSGGILVNENNTLKTLQGELNQDQKWANIYNKTTPIETDNGLHPQNIFRLVNKNKLQNISQQAYFKINKSIMSRSPNRNESNGLLFFNRYIDGDNLYYTGIRVDGTAIIKKKKNGTYHTLVQNKIYDGTYNKESSPNLLPKQKWIGLKSEVINSNFKDVSIKLFIDKEATGNWELIAEVIDDGIKWDGSSFINAGNPGIRTDFMDIEIKEYKIIPIN